MTDEEKQTPTTEGKTFLQIQTPKQHTSGNKRELKLQTDMQKEKQKVVRHIAVGHWAAVNKIKLNL